MENNENMENMNPNEPVQENSEYTEETPVVEESVETEAPKKKKKGGKKLVGKLLIFVLVAALVGTGVWWILSNFVLFPKLDSKLIERTLENKFDWGMEFEPSTEQGKMDIAVNFSEERLTEFFKSMYPDHDDEQINDLVEEFNTMFGDVDELAKASVSFKDKAGVGNFIFMDEEFNLYMSDKDIAINGENFNNGQWYGVSVENFIEDLEDSVFGPDSGSDWALPEEAFEQIENYFNTLKDAEENEYYAEEIEIIYEMIYDSFKESELADCKVKYSGNKVLGKSRSGRSQTFTITQDGLVDFLEILTEKFEDPSKKEEEALEKILELFNGYMGDNEVELDDIVDALETVTELVEENEVLEDVEITVQILYVNTCISAITVDVVIDGEFAEQTYTATIDFGANPRKDNVIKFVLEASANDEEVMYLEASYDATVDSKKTTVDFAFSMTQYYGDDEETMSGSAKIEFNKSKGTITASAGYTEDDEDVELFKLVLKYTDKKSEFTLAFDSLTVMGEDFPLPVDISIGFYDKPDSIKLPKYENILEYDEDDFMDIYEDIVAYYEEIVDKFENLG